MKMILFNQNPMITKLLESVSKKLELSVENFNHYQELSTRLKEDPEWVLIADDECLEKLDQVDWLELKETISQNKNSVCMYKKGNEMQPFLEGFEMKIQKPFLPTEILKILQKKLGSNASELEPSQNLDPTQEVLETNWDELENLGDLEALAKEEPNNEEQLLPTLNDQEEKEEIKEEEKEEVKEEVKETPKEEEKPKEETQEGETLKDKEVSKELETQEKLEIPKEETQEEVKEEMKEEVQEEVKEETQENKEEKQEKTQDSPSAQELEVMQELVKEIQENSNDQENKKETQESAEIPQDKETQEVVTEKTQAQELEIPKEKTQESAEALQETQAHELEKQEIAETPQDVEIPQSQEKETQETQEVVTEKTQVQEKETQETQEVVTEKTQVQEKETPKTQEDHYESIEDIPEPVMAKAMGEELPFLNEAVAKTPNNENDTETPKESVTETSKNENTTETPQEKEESDKTSSPLELRLNLQDLLKSLNQESLKSLLENKTLSIKITLEDKKPDA
ncbi:chemotaxis regulatory protein ChePep [Helicobacter pylori]|uniref:chemotaxis regulatory protein ChePep n=1 Tax=Helicobacter pylori TaxID=210 RepID=UPI000C30EF81|nr:chemotaxis regulatory protein ChePep [Helicobacter pylori]